MTQTTNPLAISILIRTFNSAKTLGRVLSGLKLAEGDEYIVVDSGSTDSTLSIAATHGARIIHATGPFNYSKSLNLGFRAAQNPWVLVISSHSIPLVADLLGVFRSVARDLPASVVVAYGLSTLDEQEYRDDNQVRYYTRENYTGIYLLCGNANALYRRSIWDRVPFDEKIRTGEDKAWVLEILNSGHTICIASGARTLNRSRYSLRYRFLKGYSDQRAVPHEPMSIISLVLGLGSLIKRFLRGGMPIGNLIGSSAQCVGSYFGSQQSQDNTPGK